MRKINVGFDKNTVKNILDLITRRKRIFFILFFGALLIYTFDVMYKNVYLNIRYVDYSGSFSTSDIKRESIVVKKILRDIKRKDERIKSGVSKHYEDPFNFKSSTAKDVDTGKNDEDSSIPRDLSDGLVRPGR
jgi:hypothetical protein